MFWFHLKVCFYFWGQAEQPKRFMSQRNLLNGRLHNIGTSHFFLRPETYLSLMLLVIFPIVKLPWLCFDDRLSNFFSLPLSVYKYRKISTNDWKCISCVNAEKKFLNMSIVSVIYRKLIGDDTCWKYPRDGYWCQESLQCEILNHVKLHPQPTLTVNF